MDFALSHEQQSVFDMARSFALEKLKPNALEWDQAGHLPLDVIREAALKSGDEVRLVGFGTFAVSQRAATTGRNPRTGEEIAIPAVKQPKFKAGKQLKDAVN